MTLQPLHSEFPYILGKFYFIFISVPINIKEHYTVFLLHYFYDCFPLFTTSLAAVTEGSVECSTVSFIDNHHGGDVQVLAPALGFLAKVDSVQFIV